ncbi:CsgG/HfaB family protein [Cognatiluteimonas profundi]|uniref:CsgG/HfaB family protein n=1 Tax=Cognatiluteimonas profundi TaxID=2594501 RepID=UPI00131DB249|nr:CsgG/HfaB family protein [Lysobacter profundi]
MEKVRIETTATGPTLPAAVDAALRMAVEQVNGKVVSASHTSITSGISVATQGESVDVTASSFADVVASQSGGAISDFKILRQRQISRPLETTEEKFDGSQGESYSRGNLSASESAEAHAGDASAEVAAEAQGNWDQKQGAVDAHWSRKQQRMQNEWEVTIAARVAHYRESADAKRPRLVVAMPRTATDSFVVGDRPIDSAQLAAQIRGRLSDALTQTQRFTVLDREFTGEIRNELDLIGSGMVKSEDMARAGQMLATDLILIPTIERFEYRRSERKLRLADRTLVSYAGGGAISLKLINAVTGQVVMSQTFEAGLPSTAPTTLGNFVDGGKLANTLMDSLGKDMARALLLHTFPVAVIRLSGNDVVLNQGGQAVSIGTRYQAVTLGEDLKDPQTGQSLGPMESPCCVIEVTRMGPSVAYGRIVDPGFNLPNFHPGMIELRESIQAQPSPAQAKPAVVANATPAPERHASNKVKAQPAKDDDW